MLRATLHIALFAIGAEAILRQFNFTIHSDTRSPDGFKREAYLINGQQPGPLIDVDEGDDIEVFVRNELKVDTTLHWHGLVQQGTPNMDGVPGVTQEPIPPGGNFTYRFSTTSDYGFFWYHSHFRAYYNDAIRGPLLIRPAASRQRPFESIALDNDGKAALMEAEREATNILLNDWTHELSDDIFARYNETGVFPSCVDSILANGLGRVRCLPEEILEAGSGLNSAVPSTTLNFSNMPKLIHHRESDSHDMAANISANSITTKLSSKSLNYDFTMPPKSYATETLKRRRLSPRGCMPPMMFRPGFNISSLPPETCTNTTSPLFVIPANQTRGWLALNLVNSGAVSALRVSMDGHSMLLYAADGLYVKAQKLEVLHMELGQRYSVMIKLDQQPGNYSLRFSTFPSGDMQQVLDGQAIVAYSTSSGKVKEDTTTSWMFINGSAKADAALLDPQTLSPFEESNSPPSGTANKTLSFTVNQTDIVTWVIDDSPFIEPNIPIIYGNVSSGWNSSTTLHLPLNSTIDIILNVSNRSMDTMSHPLHLHGHKFWVLGSGKGDFAYNYIAEAPAGMLNLRNPPYRDTTDLPSQGWTVIRYVTDNPGAWIFHCHLQWHVAAGMAVVLVEGGDQLPRSVGQYNKSSPSGKSESMQLATGCSKYPWPLGIILSSIATVWC